jgi:drug/metabolite transporter (DMT)-like permease
MKLDQRAPGVKQHVLPIERIEIEPKGSMLNQNSFTESHLPVSGVSRAHLGMLLWVVIVGSSFPAVEAMSEGLPPLSLTAVRFAIASLVVLPLVWRLPGRVPSLPGLALYTLMGLCLAGFFGAMFWAAHRSTALSMSALYVSVPLLAYGLGRALRVEPGSGRLLSLLSVGAIGALGLIWAGADGNFLALQFGAGEMVFLLGCAASAMYPVLSKWGLERGWLSKSAALRAFWSLLTGGVLIGGLALTMEAPQELARMTPSDVMVLVYLGTVSSGLTFWLMQRATSVLSPAAGTAYSYLVPSVSILLLMMEQPQRLGWRWLPGSLLVLFAMALLLRRDSPSGDKAIFQ